MEKYPLFIVTGTSGAGKTTVIPELRKRLNDFVVYDGDSVVVESDYNISKCNWLRIARSNALSGIKTVICSTIIPENLFDCDHLQYFSNIYYINLEINDELILERLSNRGWDDKLITNYIEFSHWLKDNKNKAFNPPMYSIDASNKTVDDVADKIYKFIISNLT